MSDLIQEVEESIKQDQLEKFWKDYGSYVIWGVVLVILTTAFFSGWRSWNASVNEAQTQMIVRALASESPGRALSDAVSEMRGGTKALAYLTAAGDYVQKGELDKALQIYERAEKEKDLPSVLHDLAVLMAVRTSWATAPEKGQAITLLGKLSPLMTGSSPWAGYAYVQAAVIEAHANEDFAAARKHLQAALSDKRLPPSLLQRARALDHVYLLRQDRKANEKAETQMQAKDTQ